MDLDDSFCMDVMPLGSTIKSQTHDLSGLIVIDCIRLIQATFGTAIKLLNLKILIERGDITSLFHVIKCFIPILSPWGHFGFKT